MPTQALSSQGFSLLFLSHFPPNLSLPGFLALIAHSQPQSPPQWAQAFISKLVKGWLEYHQWKGNEDGKNDRS